MKGLFAGLHILMLAASLSASPFSDRCGIFSNEEKLPFAAGASRWYPSPFDQDTIFYDDGSGYSYSTAGLEWGVRFTPQVPCTLQAVLTMTFGSGDLCSLFVRDDSSGWPGPVVRDTVYLGGAHPAWDRIELDVHYYDADAFWVTGRYPKPPYVVADSVNTGRRSYYSFDGRNWIDYSGGDLMMRAVVAYGETLAHDVSITDVRGVLKGVWVDTAYADTIRYGNFGTAAEDFVIEVAVKDSLGIIELDTLSDTLSAIPGAWGLYFSGWTPQSYGQTYSLAAISHLAGDMNPGNDTFFCTAYSYMDGEVSYDDFTCEKWLNVGMDANDKFAVAFHVPNPPCYATGARFYVDDTTTFEQVALCPDSAGLPDTVNPYVTVSSVAAPEPATWARVSFDTSLTWVDADTVWLVLRWPDSKAGPYVGSDRHHPVDCNSWAYSDSTGWVPWTESDFMMRIVCAKPTGIADMQEKMSAPMVLQSSPNPFSRQIRLGVVGAPQMRSLDEKVVSLTAYDLAGRAVRNFGQREMGSLVSETGLIWDGCDDDRALLPSGVYMLVLESPDWFSVTKTVLLR